MDIKKPIITILKRAFAIGLIFMSLISLIGLLSWYQQTKQVNYLLDDYLPEIHLERRLEEHLGQFINELNNFSLIHEATLQPFYFRRLNQQLDNIEKMLIQLYTEDVSFHFPITSLRQLVLDINQQITMDLAIEQKKQEILTKIYWLSDDFNSEAMELIQELSQQQLNNANASAQQAVRHELQSIYHFSYQESQLKNELLNLLYLRDKNETLSEFEHIKLRFDYGAKYLPNTSNQVSLTTLKQILHSLFDLVKTEQDIGQLVQQIKNSQQYAIELNQRQEMVIGDIRQNLLNALEQKKDQLNQFNQKIKNQTHLLGGITFGLFTICLILLWSFSHFYLKRKLTFRFSKLIQSVEQLNQGIFPTQIQLKGNDEIAQISKLLQNHIHIIQERVKITQELQQTQNELIQAGKLAIVGQTMTTIAHEINQPLNAISIYLYTLKKWVARNDPEQAIIYIEKIANLTERINGIIKQLRFFTRRSDAQLSLTQHSLVPAIENVWQLLETRHQQLNGKLNIKGQGIVKADGLLLEQVLINLITNSLEAASTEAPVIEIEIKEKNTMVQVLIHDNGKGWQMDDPSKMMQPFYTTKAVGLGLGLHLCQHIMTQFGGSITLASTLEQHALIILEFRKP